MDNFFRVAALPASRLYDPAPRAPSEARGYHPGVVSIDIRTRRATDVRDVEAAAFLDEELPALMAERAELAVPAAREMRLRSMALVVDDRTWVLAFDGDRFLVRPGNGDLPAVHTVVGLDAEQLADLVNDLRTPVGFLAGGDLDMRSGRLETFLDWWVVLRSVLDGRAAYAAGDVTFQDTEGEALDLGRSFTLEDDAEVISHHLAEAGFIHLRGVFTEDEMRAVSSEMDEAAAGYAPGDGRSWWARTHNGDERLVRMQRFQEVSPTTAQLMTDDRLLGIGRLTEDGHRLGKPGGNPSWVEALVKPLGVVEGISDVPWHKDCSLGSHSYRCCSLTVGISVTSADANSGQLGVVAGSHRALTWPGFVRKGLDLPQIQLPTVTGDVTVHCSCTLHMSHPPVTRERRVLYTDLTLPTDEPDVYSLNEGKLRKIREAAPTTVSQQPGHVPG